MVNQVKKIMRFPSKKYKNFSDYSKDYLNNLFLVSKKLDQRKLNIVTNLIEKKINSNSKIFVCGNGGSAAIANHYVCDFSKLLKENTNLNPNFYSFSSNIEMITAIANDISYDDIFIHQASTFMSKKDLLIILSSSGSSKNILKVANYCNKNKIDVVGICGFNGGKLSKKIKNIIKIHSKNYGMIEDITHMIMHIFLQFLKLKNLRNNKIKHSRF